MDVVTPLTIYIMTDEELDQFLRAELDRAENSWSVSEFKAYFAVLVQAAEEARVKIAVLHLKRALDLASGHRIFDSTPESLSHFNAYAPLFQTGVDYWGAKLPHASLGNEPGSWETKGLGLKMLHLATHGGGPALMAQDLLSSD